MSGHSKWATIKHKKSMADARRGKVFSKLSKAITVAVKEGGVDEATNFALRLAIQKARQANMPKENIERAIARGQGSGGEGALEVALYEGMGPGGVSILVEVLTDNKNRALTNIKTIFNKNGGNMDAKVLWQFERKGVVRAEAEESIADKDNFELSLIEAGAEDINWDGSRVEIISALSDLQAVEKAVSEAGLKVESAEPEYIAKDKIKLSEADEEKLMKFLELLDDDDDVNNVFTNAA
ncbi:YebC/PmpR family DNA-binding transcriptional regulator [Candidatus Parcubacteria bacterium]|nr:MAG: YebC/PmpR family DNA-binding transcriptional regulator [Candidatus Parcubacteria bacterium]